MTDDIADDMKAAAEQLASEAEPTEAPPVEEAAPEPTKVEAQPPDAAPEDEVGGEEKPKPDGRDSKGRFAKGEQKPGPIVEKKPVLPTVRPSGEKTAPVQAQPDLRAPQGLNAQEREAWKSWPRELQQMVARRESDYAKGMQRLAEPARLGEQVSQALRPHAHVIQAMGGNALAAVDNLMQTGRVFYFGTETERARALVGMMQQFGVSVDSLANAIDGGGRAPQGGQQAPQSFDPRQLIHQAKQEFAQEWEQRQGNARLQSARSEVDKFADEHEFFFDVQSRMAREMRIAAEEGSPLTYEDAYDLACRVTPSVAAVLEQRAKAEQANAARASTQRARAAGATVRNSPSAPAAQSDSGDDIMADLRAAAASFSR